MGILLREKHPLQQLCSKGDGLIFERYSITHTTHTHQVKEVYVKENDSIGEDEVILEFYPEEQD